VVTEVRPDVERWDAWVDLVAQYINKVVDALHPEIILLIPTGSSALLPHEELRQCMDLRTIRSSHGGQEEIDQTKKEAKLQVIVADHPAGMIVKGAAKCALQVYLHSMRAERKLAAAIGKRYADNMYSMVALTPGKVQDLFTLLDVNGDGFIDQEDLIKATDGLNLALPQSEVVGLLRRLSLAGHNIGPNPGGESKEMFTLPRVFGPKGAVRVRRLDYVRPDADSWATTMLAVRQHSPLLPSVSGTLSSLLPTYLSQHSPLLPSVSGTLSSLLPIYLSRHSPLSTCLSGTLFSVGCGDEPI
jgi:hypothetical protein